MGMVGNGRGIVRNGGKWVRNGGNRGEWWIMVGNDGELISECLT